MMHSGGTGVSGTCVDDRAALGPTPHGRFARRRRPPNLSRRLLRLPAPLSNFVRAAAGPSGAGQRLDQEVLLNVEPVLRLLQGEAARPIEDLAGDLLASVSRQAMHRYRSRTSQIQQSRVHLVAGERGETGVGLLLLAHRNPNVGGDGVGAADELSRIV